MRIFAREDVCGVISIFLGRLGGWAVIKILEYNGGRDKDAEKVEG